MDSGAKSSHHSPMGNAPKKKPKPKTMTDMWKQIWATPASTQAAQDKGKTPSKSVQDMREGLGLGKNNKKKQRK